MVGTEAAVVGAEVVAVSAVEVALEDLAAAVRAVVVRAEAGSPVKRDGYRETSDGSR